VTAYVHNDQSQSNDVYLVVSSSRVIPNDVNHVPCAFVEYPASALLSEEQEHGVKEQRGGGKEKEEGEEELDYERDSRFLSHVRDRNITLSSYQVNIWFVDDVSLTPTRLVITFVVLTPARQ
jgi:hypothetical protein